METRKATIAGAAARWRVVGDGPPVVLVHGLSGSGRWWDAVLPALATRYTCHVIDVPRFRSALHPKDTAEWLAEWTEAAGLQRVRLVGHSLGGAAGAQLAARRPDLVEALVLVSAAGMPSGRRLLGHILPLASSVAASPGVIRRLGTDAARAGPASLIRGCLYAARADVREQAATVIAPTMLIWGDRDDLVPHRLAADWQRAIPSSRLVTLHGAGHVPMIERPGAFARTVLEFLEQVDDAVGGGPVGGMRSVGDDGQPPTR